MTDISEPTPELGSVDHPDYLEHYGILRKSGRYPWGSGGPENVSSDPDKRNRTFLDYVQGMRNEGMKDTEIAQAMGISTTTLRAAYSIARNESRAADQARAFAMKEKGMSNGAIAAAMGYPNESSVRSLLAPRAEDRGQTIQATAEMLKRQVEDKTYLDIGGGTGAQLGMADTKLLTAVAMLQEEGYRVHYQKVLQVGTGKETTLKILTKGDVDPKDVYANKDKIKTVQEYTDDGGRNWNAIQTPINVDSNRISVRYAEEGGADADGVIYVRPGVDDISLGGKRYAQVRIAVDGTHYLKGMALYKDDLPDGVDLEFNTNKSKKANKLDAMKPLNTGDDELPFGSVVRQRTYIDKDGKQKLSAMNIVNEEGNWNEWSRTISSQVLSKQRTPVAQEQLDLAFQIKKAQFDEINSLTNPAVKRKLLESFADDADSAAVHLKAAAFPRQKTQVILPINDLPDNEVYAPNFKNGERVALVRFPHGGTFEIPELTVNNRNAAAKKALGTNPVDAIGINSKVAARLSGADFDGDTVLVIPNNNRRLVSTTPLPGLKGFDPQAAYPSYPGMKRMSPKTKQIEMGDVSNLITDMTIRGATRDELARAVRHSMVVIDAEKHNLNWKESKARNGIRDLKKKYQATGNEGGRQKTGASTLISQATSPKRVDERRDRRQSEGGPVDKATGKRVYTKTGANYVNKQGKTVFKTTETTRLGDTDDAFTLSSGTPIETAYATHSNKLKALANTARKTAIETRNKPYSPAAKVAYSNEVASLNRKLNTALQNAPRERQAQLAANARISAIKASNPDLAPDKLRKLKSQALTEARLRTGAKKERVDITPSEWLAIQAGAVAPTKLTRILDNADLDAVKKLATPREQKEVSTAQLARAKAYLNMGYTQAEISENLGIPTSTLNDAILGKGE